MCNLQRYAVVRLDDNGELFKYVPSIGGWLILQEDTIVTATKEGVDGLIQTTYLRKIHEGGFGLYVTMPRPQGFPGRLTNASGSEVWAVLEQPGIYLFTPDHTGHCIANAQSLEGEAIGIFLGTLQALGVAADSPALKKALQVVFSISV